LSRAIPTPPPFPYTTLFRSTVTVTGTPLDDTKGAKPIQFTVTVTQPDAVEDLDFDRYVTGNIRHALPYLDRQLEGNYTYGAEWRDRKSTRLNFSHVSISYAV